MTEDEHIPLSEDEEDEHIPLSEALDYLKSNFLDEEYRDFLESKGKGNIFNRMTNYIKRIFGKRTF